MNRFRYLKGDKVESVIKEFPIVNNVIEVSTMNDLEEAARFIRYRFGSNEIYPADETRDISNLRYGWVFDGGEQVIQVTAKMLLLNKDMSEEDRNRYFRSERGKMAYAAHLLTC
jgi:hypothetical protein